MSIEPPQQITRESQENTAFPIIVINSGVRNRDKIPFVPIVQPGSFDSSHRTNERVKKMTNLTKNRASRNEGLTWTPLRKTETEKNCYVEYYARNPETGKMQRKRVKFNQFVSGRERDNMIQQYIRNTEAKLLNGWNPFATDGKELKTSVLLKSIQKEFVEYLHVTDKRPKTIVDYSNRLKHFCDWAQRRKMKYVGECTPMKVEDYLNHRLIKDKISATSRNNERTFLSAFFTWCVNRFYLLDNPCKDIKQLRREPKRRRIITDEELRRIAAYFLHNDKYMLLAVMFQYYTLVRPNELLHLRIRDINFEEQYLVVPAQYSKNHREQPVSLNDRLIELMIDMGIDKAPSDAWLFGYGCRPNYVPGNHDLFRYRWKLMRDALGISSDVQFYSLKDTGIVDLINAEGVLLARDQARHSSIAITNLYAQYGGVTAHEQTKHFQGKL